jgi:hypothetical protein
MNNCSQCPNGTKEWYHFLCFEWDVEKARKFVARKPSGVVRKETLEKYGLPVDGPPQEKVDEQDRRYFTIGLMYVNEEHLTHIPDEKLSEPILVAPLIVKGERFMLIIDGAHRATKLARQNKTVHAVTLKDAESLACLNIGTHDRKQLKVFPRIKAAVL